MGNGDIVSQVAQLDISTCISLKLMSITKSKDYLKDSQKQARVKFIEAEIDQLVYKLYDLTPEEIKIVEGEN